jgi:Skp family chaperone for outer membrane proteins
VLKASRKVQAIQADVRSRTQEAQHKLEGLKKEIQRYQTEGDATGTPAGRREEYALKIRQLKREMEDEEERVRAMVSRMTGDAVSVAYRDVEEAANRVAKLKGLELVLFYNDAVTEEDFSNANNLQRKLSQSGTLMPMIVAPGMDITEAVTEGLNREHGP